MKKRIMNNLFTIILALAFVVGMTVQSRQINEQQNQINILKSDNLEKEDLINSYLNEIDLLQNNISDLEINIDELEKRNKELEESVDDYKDQLAKKQSSSNSGSSSNGGSSTPTTYTGTDLLARIVNAEAKGESYEGKVAVANVVLNRVNSSLWPNTIEGVVYQQNQFAPVRNGAIHEKPDQSAIDAAHAALNGTIVMPAEVIFFAHHTVDFSKNATFYQQLGNHKFWTK